MNEAPFRNWLSKSKYSKKVQSDIVSRLKRLEHEMGNCNLDNEYDKNDCNNLLIAFKNKGYNEEMNQHSSNRLPVGQYTLSTFSYALRIYIKYRIESE